VPKPRLTTDELLSRMHVEQDRLDAEAEEREPAAEVKARPRPVLRWMFALAPAAAILIIRVILLTHPEHKLGIGDYEGNRPDVRYASPKRPGVAQTPRLDLYAEGPSNAIKPVPEGSVLDLGGAAKIHLWTQGGPGDREALLVMEDPRGGLKALWPAQGGLRGGPCWNSCAHLDLPVELRALPGGKVRAVLWLGPGPLDASKLKTLGHGAPPSLPGASTSTWFDLQR
jgi:hypothetical protein